MNRNHSGYQYLEQEQRRQTEYLASLHETALGLITRRKLADLLQSIVDRACALLDLTNGFIYLCQPGDVEMELDVGAGFYGQHVGHRVRQDEGFVGKVWRTGRSQVMDYAWDKGLGIGREGLGTDREGGLAQGAGMDMPLPQPQAASSIVGVPLRSHDQVLGVLGLVAGGRSDAFQFEEIAVLSQFARLASIAIDNARLYDQAQAEITERKQAEEALERRARQLSILNEIGSEIAMVLRLESVLDKAVHLVQERLGYHHVAIFTVDLERDELVMQARAGALTNVFPPDHRLRMEQGMVGWVASHGQALTANDVGAEPSYVNLYPELVGTRAELAVPIRLAGVVLGVLDVQSPELNAFNPDDALVMETLANQLAVTMENARLYEAVRRELAERERAEATLQSIFRVAPIGIGLVTNRVFDWTNAALQEMVGRSGEELVGQSARIVYADDEEFERVGRVKYERITRDGTGAIETRFKHKDGSMVDVVLTSTPLNPADLSAGVVFTALDITLEKQARAELEAAQALLTAAIEQTPAGVLVADAADGRIRIANAAALSIRGEGAEDGVGEGAGDGVGEGAGDGVGEGTRGGVVDIPIELYPERWQTLHPDGAAYAPEDLPLFRAILQGETSRDVEVMIQRESGERRWASVNAAPIRDAEGKIVAGIAVFPDITERKLAEQALRESEEMFRFLFEQAPIGMAITDLEGHYLRVNRAHCQVLGYSSEEMLSLNIADVTPPEEIGVNLELRAKLLRGEIPYFQLEKRFITKAGEVVHALLQVALVHDAQQRPLHFLGQVVDITDRKEAEAALSRSVERYRRFVEQSYEGVWEIDQRGVTVFANSRMAEILGYEDAQALLGRRLYDFFPQDYTGPLLPLVEGDQPSKAQDCVLTRADGADLFAILSALPHRSEDGRFAGATLFVTDITQRKQAERALRHSESRYRTLFENASDAIFIYDLSGRFLEANRVACQRLGYSLEELQQMTPADIEAPDYAARLPERIDELQRYGHHLFETVHVRQDGITIPTELSSRLIDYDGQPAVLSIARDLTERKQMALVMVRTERLAAMGQLAAALAHEINNPLQSIGSSMELALDFPLKEEERLEYLEAVRHEIERLMSLTGKVLDFARPVRLEREPISLAEVVRYAITLAGKQLQHSRIHIHLEMPEDLPLVKASRDQLAQVFLNLVINALEAMPGGGRLSISAHAEKGQVTIYFQDTGPGIPDHALETVFEPFHTTKEEGTGLGLAVSYSIIQQHGGSIAAGNAPSGGALFTIVLPETPVEELD